jgi:hypothetical protein
MDLTQRNPADAIHVPDQLILPGQRMTGVFPTSGLPLEIFLNHDHE